MKKTAAIFLSVVMMSSVMFGGCSKTKSTEPAETEPAVTETETEATTEEPFTVERHIDQDKLREAEELYVSKSPEKDKFIPVFADGIRGYGSYTVSMDRISFYYSGLDFMSINLIVDPVSEMAYIGLQMQYDDESFVAYTESNKVNVTDVESLVDKVSALETGSFDLYDDSALEGHSEDIKNDIKIMYSRLIVMADNAFPEIGLGLEDLGIDLGDKYRDIDPFQTLSNEIQIVNEHVFENGVCSDCGMTWNEYYYDAVGELSGSPDDTWHSIYGQDSSSMISGSDYVQCSADSSESAEVFYLHTDDNWNELNCKAISRSYDDEVDVYLKFSFEEGMYFVDDGIVSYKFIYSIIIEADPGEYSEIFRSRESFEEAARVYLFVMEDGSGSNVMGVMEDDEIAELFAEVENCTYYNRDEILDMIWEYHEALLSSMDNAMIWLDTDLSDMGINWR